MNEKMKMTGITLLGLGPGDPELLTLEAWQHLQQISEIYLRTSQHPTVAGFPENLIVHSFDNIYDTSDSFEMVYEKIIESVLELGKRPQGVTYAVPGHPFVAEATCPEIVKRAKLLNIPVRIIEAVSFLEPTFTALEIDPFPDLVMMDALDLAASHHPIIPPNRPALIAQIYSRRVAADVKLTLLNVYPDEHPVKLVHGAGTRNQMVEELFLYEIDRSDKIGLLTSLYLPLLGEKTSLEEFQDLIAHLRAPDGCPWDRKQTHTSLRKHLLSETYELIAALDEQDPVHIQEELGDLLLQIVLHAQIAFEDGEFAMADVLRGINQKIVRRHPHVFGDVQVDGVGGVLSNWEKIKEQERAENGKSELQGILSGVPMEYPALAQAQEMQDRAKRVGFDWSDIAAVKDKVLEEWQEVAEARNQKERASELGDLLFSVVNLIRWYELDAETALREANQRFRTRFNYIEENVQVNGRKLSEMTLAEMDKFWEQAKKLESKKDL